MQITSGLFAIFLVVVVIIHYLLPRRAQNVWLLLASYAFCVTWAWHFALTLLMVTTVNYAIAGLLRRDLSGNRPLLWISILFNVLVLVVFRMGDFFVPDLSSLLQGLGLRTDLGVVQILLPVGLSFYIVENISYQVDVYRGQVPASQSFVDYALYQAYFPKLLAGPIERAGKFLPLLAQQRRIDNEALARSATLIAVGLFRKMIVADTLTVIIPWDVFEAPSNFTAPDLWAWLFVYGFALYNDFAGYTSIVRGLSVLFGIELSANFRQPYFSRNFGEFWNRWHITLSHWLRDYVYYPTLRSLLRRNRNPKDVLNIVVPPMLTMLASGLWHGFSLHMLVWGGLHGVYLITERMLSLRRVGAPGEGPGWLRVANTSIVFLLVMWAWVPFRVDLPIAIEFWQQLLSFGDIGLRYRRLLIAAAYVLLAVAVDFVQHHYQDETIFLRWPRPVRAFCMATVIFLVVLLSTGSDVEPFVYQGF